MLNYQVGRLFALKISKNERVPFLNKKSLARTQEYFDRYGAKTIIITRFLPVVRTFAPFLAGVGNMPYGKFMLYNLAGGIFWIVVGILAGFFFGNIPFVSEHFSVVVLVIVVMSIVPALWAIRKRPKHN